MAMLNYDVFEAFKSAGADDEKAPKAAEALANVDLRFVRIDEGVQKLDVRLGALDARVGKAEAKLDFHSWMFGIVVALNVAILVRLLIAV